ncbi:MAG: hypothetical protein WKG07_07965 [Hymenobacter sp.]
MTLPATLKYTKDHEWIRLEGDVAYHRHHRPRPAASWATSCTWTSTPLDKDVAQHDVFGTVEAVKTVFRPVQPHHRHRAGSEQPARRRPPKPSIL